LAEDVTGILFSFSGKSDRKFKKNSLSFHFQAENEMSFLASFSFSAETCEA